MNSVAIFGGIMIRTLIYILSKVISDDLSFYPAKSPFIKEFEFSR